MGLKLTRLTRMRPSFGLGPRVSLPSLRAHGATLLVLLVCFLGLALPAFGQSLVDQLEDNAAKKRKAEAKAERFAAEEGRLEDRVAVLDAEAQRIQAEVNGLDSTMDKLNGRIATVQADLTSAQQKVTALTMELQGILAKLDRRTDLFTNRAVAAYMAGPSSHIEGLLSSATFNEIVDRTSYYESALDADSELVAGIEELRAETEDKRQQVEDEQEQIAENKLRLEADKTELARVLFERRSALDAQRLVVAEKEALLAEASSNRQRYERIASQLEADNDRIQSILAARAAAAAASSSSALPTGGGQLLWPANGPLTSPYGYRTHPIFGDTRLHTGIDIGAGYGAPVVAGDSGTVAYAGALSGYGNVIVVDHGGGLATTYNHLSAYAVSTGQSVGRGAVVGNVGCTGYCTGPHLHFEVRVNGSPVDPMGYL
jgi:murein DD-endopeptidase MepM/ murein hydrolase activator NlpD